MRLTEAEKNFIWKMLVNADIHNCDLTAETADQLERSRPNSEYRKSVLEDRKEIRKNRKIIDRLIDKFKKDRQKQQPAP